MWLLYLSTAIISAIGVGVFATQDADLRAVSDTEFNRPVVSAVQASRASRGLRRLYQIDSTRFPSPPPGQSARIPDSLVREALRGGYAVPDGVVFFVDSDGRIYQEVDPTRTDIAFNSTAFAKVVERIGPSVNSSSMNLPNRSIPGKAAPLPFSNKENIALDEQGNSFGDGIQQIDPATPSPTSAPFPQYVRGGGALPDPYPAIPVNSTTATPSVTSPGTGSSSPVDTAFGDVQAVAQDLDAHGMSAWSGTQVVSSFTVAPDTITRIVKDQHGRPMYRRIIKVGDDRYWNERKFDNACSILLSRSSVEYATFNHNFALALSDVYHTALVQDYETKKAAWIAYFDSPVDSFGNRTGTVYPGEEALWASWTTLQQGIDHYDALIAGARTHAEEEATETALVLGDGILDGGNYCRALYDYRSTLPDPSQHMLVYGPQAELQRFLQSSLLLQQANLHTDTSLRDSPDPDMQLAYELANAVIDMRIAYTTYPIPSPNNGGDGNSI
ncbi:MAG: hypothetical protein D6788_09730 [Planctomycetota bacterium]|nr:MAG: hypothetical protein D6788_09730 [Planctomycetota bacterium]